MFRFFLFFFFGLIEWVYFPVQQNKMFRELCVPLLANRGSYRKANGSFFIKMSNNLHYLGFFNVVGLLKWGAAGFRLWHRLNSRNPDFYFPAQPQLWLFPHVTDLDVVLVWIVLLGDIMWAAMPWGPPGCCLPPWWKQSNSHSFRCVSWQVGGRGIK